MSRLIRFCIAILLATIVLEVWSVPVGAQGSAPATGTAGLPIGGVVPRTSADSTGVDLAQAVMASLIRHKAHDCGTAGCSWAEATRDTDNEQVTIWAWGGGYRAKRTVWVHILVTDALTMEPVFDEKVTYTSNSRGDTQKLTTFVDCGFPVLVAVWTWYENPPSGLGFEQPMAQLQI